MAVKKAKKKAVPKPFYVGWTECGGISQLEMDTESFSTAEEARAFIDKELEAGNYGYDITYVIVQIVDVGKPSNVKWTGKTDLM